MFAALRRRFDENGTLRSINCTNVFLVVSYESAVRVAAWPPLRGRAADLVPFTWKVHTGAETVSDELAIAYQRMLPNIQPG
jgi:hypothetical protein